MRFTSLTTAYRAKDVKEKTKTLPVKLKFKNRNIEHANSIFEDVYNREYNSEELLIGSVRLAMQNEFENSCNDI